MVCRIILSETCLYTSKNYNPPPISTVTNFNLKNYKTPKIQTTTHCVILEVKLVYSITFQPFSTTTKIIKFAFLQLFVHYYYYGC